MSFFAPYMLWGTVAAGIPIAIHFLFRSRYRTVHWAAMAFLLQSIQETTRRLRFQELALLCLRVAILLLLALALARPSSRAGGGTSDAVDAVLLIDVSYSMDARDGAVTRLDQAKSAAQAVLDCLPPRSTAQIIAIADRATRLGPAQPTDLTRAKQVIDELTIQQLATDFKPGAHEMLAALQHGTAANREAYLFSDLQRSGWEREASALVELWRAIHERAAVTFVRCGGSTPNNVAVAAIVPQTGVPRAGERVGFSVLVRNTGADTVGDLTVSLRADGSDLRESQPISDVPPGETRTVSLTAQFDKPGLHVITAEVGPDDLAADNKLSLVVLVRDQVRALVVDGAIDEREPEKSASFFLLHALTPVKEADRPRYWLQPRLVPPDRAAPGMLGDKDLCILVNVPAENDSVRGIRGVAPEFVDGLARFVRSGKPLWIVAGDKVNAEAYNRVFGSRNLLPLELKRVCTLAENAEVGIDRSSIRDASFWRLRDDDAFQPLNRIKTRSRIECVAAAGADPVLLRFTDGQPALASQKVGTGQVMILTTSVNPAWTDWPLWLGQFVPFVDMAMNRLLQSTAQEHNGAVGEPIHCVVPESEAVQSYLVHRPDGQSRRLGLPEPIDGRMTLTTEETAWAGVYRIARADEPAQAGDPFAMRAAPSEAADLTSLTDAEIDDRLGFAPAHVVAANLGADPGAAERLRREWTPSLLWIVLIAAVAEMALAWWCGRAR